MFFKTRQCTHVHRLGVQKRAKLKKKGVCLVLLTNFGKDMANKLRKTHAKTRIYRGFFFIPENKRVCFFGHIDKFWKGHGGQIKKNA